MEWAASKQAVWSACASMSWVWGIVLGPSLLEHFSCHVALYFHSTVVLTATMQWSRLPRMVNGVLFIGSSVYSPSQSSKNSWKNPIGETMVTMSSFKMFSEIIYLLKKVVWMISKESRRLLLIVSILATLVPTHLSYSYSRQFVGSNRPFSINSSPRFPSQPHLPRFLPQMPPFPPMPPNLTPRLMPALPRPWPVNPHLNRFIPQRPRLPPPFPSVPTFPPFFQSRLRLPAMPSWNHWPFSNSPTSWETSEQIEARQKLADFLRGKSQSSSEESRWDFSLFFCFGVLYLALFLIKLPFYLELRLLSWP